MPYFLINQRFPFLLLREKCAPYSGFSVRHHRIRCATCSGITVFHAPDFASMFNVFRDLSCSGQNRPEILPVHVIRSVW
jgi:hypothetical protein